VRTPYPSRLPRLHLLALTETGGNRFSGVAACVTAPGRSPARGARPGIRPMRS
jgi:hypothetical protein